MTRLPAGRRAASCLVAVLVPLGGLAACSDGGDADAGAEGRPAGAGTTERADAPPPEEFTGPVEDFYRVPDPLPPGGPGDLVRVQPIEAPAGEAGLRVMYRSTDGEGDERAVTGVVYHPTGPAPEGGWPILVSGHGTTGIAPECAPSRVPLAPDAFGVQGVRVATDYIGLGPEGELHSYLSAAAEGHAMLDSVRAAQQAVGPDAGDRYLLTGHSQGGHAALVAAEQAADRLPDHELLGTVAIAPGAQFTETYEDDVQVRIITTMVLFGAAAEDPAVDPADYLNPEAVAAAAGVVEDACLGTIIDTMAPLAAAPDFYVQDPLDVDVTREWMEANEPGRAAVDAPLLLISGDRDLIVVPARTHALFDRLCGLGQVVELVDLPDADHGSEPVQAAGRIGDWLTDRLEGRPAPSTCP